MVKVDIKGPIVSNDDAYVYDLFEVEHTSPKKVDSALSQLQDGEDVTVEISSGGGSVFAGSEIYTKLKKLNTNIEIVGLAGSAASFIAMAGKNISISPTAQIMVHRASTIEAGNKSDFEDASDFLSSIDESISYAYELKTGLPQNELLDMMSKETWLNAQKAKEKGFVDEIMFDKKDAVASVGITIPNNVINKVKNNMPNNNKSRTTVTVDDMTEAIENMKQDILKEIKSKKQEPPTKNSWLF